MRRLAWVLLVLPGLAVPAGRAPRPAPAASSESAPVAARLLAVRSPATLLVESAGQPLQVRVRAVQPELLCAPERRRLWAEHLLPVGAELRLGPLDRDGARTVTFSWQGQPVDWGLLVLRAGQGLPGKLPDTPGPLPPAYAWAAREARAEGRGLWGECAGALNRFRRSAAASGIPPAVLYGIAMVESAAAGRPWPWTLNVAGEARRYPDRIVAWRALEQLLAAGVDRVDVGLMQIHWRFHGDRFRDRWEALDPEINIAVAAAILRDLWRTSGSLEAAIARYHSADPVRGQPYARRVIAWMQRLPPSAGP